MSKLKNITIILGMVIFIIFGINGISYATSLDNLKVASQLASKVKLTDTYTISSSNYFGNLKHQVFCINRHKNLSADGITYKVVDIVKIKGATATSKKDPTFEVIDKENAKLISAIYFADRNSDEADGMRHAIWHNMYPWMEAVGEGFFEDVWKLNQDDTNESYTNPDDRKEYLKKFDASGDYKNADEPYINNLYKDQQPNASTYTKNGKKYFKIGPFKLDFKPNIDQLEVRDKNNKIINEDYVSYLLPNDEIVTITSTIPSKKEFYILISQESNVEGIKNIYIKTYEKTVSEVIDGIIVFLQAPNKSYQNLIAAHAYKSGDELVPEFINIPVDIDLKANLTVTKVDQETGKPLKDVCFRLRNENGAYICKDAQGNISLVGPPQLATQYKTDSYGQFTVERLPLGKYTIEEVFNPNEYYEITPGQDLSINVKPGNNTKTITNRQKYVDLSGYVWVDNISGKMSTIDNLRNTKDDSPLEGVKVSLQYSGREVVPAISTDGNGYYKFSKVDVDTLGSPMCIVFEYNGLKYTNVNANINDDNGSKAAENQTTRSNFNQEFSVIEGWNNSRNTGLARSSIGAPKWLYYNNDTQNHTSTLQGIDEVNKFPITAGTLEANYDLKVQYLAKKRAGKITNELTNINLGLYIREQPEMILVKDIQSVTVNANNKTHVYEYGNRFDKDNNGNITDNSSRFGVEYGNKFKEGTYERAIYKADYESAIKDNTQLEVYVTYKIAVKNASTSLKTKINTIVDYYDKRYSIEQVGTEYKEGNVTNEVGHTDVTSYNNDTYAKTIINLGDNMIINRQQPDSVYIKFKLSKEAIKEALDHESDKPEKLFYKNIAEIDSYSIFDANDKIYAGIDKKSAPGNIVAGDVTTYENDTDMAPAMKLKIEGTRTMSGSVFLDYTDGQLKTGQVRQGDGVYGDKDKGIEGADILLEEISGTGKTYTAKTGPDGNFNISDYIAGDYKLTYTWGGQKVDGTEITVQNYKATIYNDQDRQYNKKWYIMTEKRYSDAFDDMDTRKNIDAQLKNVKYNSDDSIDIKTMKSTTPEMNIEIEYNYDKLISGGDIKPVYNVTNVDFGIVERARQEVELTKRVKTLKLTLANGQVISNVEFKYDQNGKLTATGEKSHMTFMGTNTKGDSNRFIKLELDNELIQGANLEVGYEILFKNKSENDYDSENFYKYGIINIGAVKITPTAIIDYLDKDWSFEESKNTDWEALTLEELKTKDKVAETVYDKTKTPDTDINNRIILYTEKLSGKALSPNEMNSVMLNVSKILTTTDEISLGNETEIVELNKTGGAKITRIIPGNYVPGSSELTDDADEAERVIVTPSTGENLNYVLPITIGLLALITLGTGVILIKKKVL